MNDCTYSMNPNYCLLLMRCCIGCDKCSQYERTADVQPVKRGHWIEKSEEYYRLWQDSGRSWDDMPYFVTGLKFACSCCFNQYDVNAESVEEWDFCPKCGADMRDVPDTDVGEIANVVEFKKRMKQ